MMDMNMGMILLITYIVYLVAMLKFHKQMAIFLCIAI